MADRVVGIHYQSQSLPETLALIRRCDEAGVESFWVTSGGFGPDSLTTLAVAGSQTQQIQLGTAIAVIYSRHPVAMIQQAVAIEQLAPGRLRLGIGTSHRPTVEGTYGLGFERPLEYLREYTDVLEGAFGGGQVDFQGKRLRVQARLARPMNVPVYLAALRPTAYTLAGEISQGAISWVSPSAFLRDVAKPALLAGAAQRSAAGPQPRLVGQAFGLVTDDVAALKQLGRERLGVYARLTFYQEMFAAAGHPEARNGVVSDDLVDDLVLVGDEATVTRGIRRFLDAGCDELILSLIPGGANAEASVQRTIRLLGQRGF
jgi:F420-dependent oxidoreductase-like protein